MERPTHEWTAEDEARALETAKRMLAAYKFLIRDGTVYVIHDGGCVLKTTLAALNQASTPERAVWVR